MPVFSEIAKGTFARKSIHLDIAGVKRPIDVRVLCPTEEADVLAAAAAFATERGSSKPSADDPLYELGLWVHTAAIACVDPSSPKDKPAPYFDGGAEQIIGSELLTRTHLAYIYEHQELWQSECSPYERSLDDGDLLARTIAIAEGDAGPFVGLRPSTRWLYVRGLAALHLNLLAASLPSGSSSSAEPADSPS